MKVTICAEQTDYMEETGVSVEVIIGEEYPEAQITSDDDDPTPRPWSR